MDFNQVAQKANNLAAIMEKVSQETNELKRIAQQAVDAAPTADGDPFIAGLTAFVLACFVGYYVVWKVTPALHSPLMAVTNAISSVIIVGALLAAGPDISNVSIWFGMIAIILASINIFGGFIVTQRMLQMFSKK